MKANPFMKRGVRVRCVDVRGIVGFNLKVGEEYAVSYVTSYRISVYGVGGSFYHRRFKPVVRVQMGREQIA